MAKVSAIHKRLSSTGARGLQKAVGAIALDSQSVPALSKVGIHVSEFALQSYQRAYAQDSAVNPAAPNIQFLQAWLTGQVHVVTAARKADQLFGVTTAGSWEDEEIIQEVMELTGAAGLYSDFGSIPLSSWNLTYEKRGVVRFEEGLQVGELEGLRSGRIGVNSADNKRKAAALALEVSRNRVAFYGFGEMTTRPVYGVLNDPNLPAYVNVAAEETNTAWSDKTREGIIRDILSGLQQLRTRSGEIVDPTSTPIKLVVASDCVDYLASPNGAGAQIGETPNDWLNKNYPNVKVESCVEFNKANGAANVFYLFAETVGDSGTDGGGVIEQIVPSRIRALGVDTGVKVVTEDFTNATSGCWVKRPYAVYRASGI